jgi:hypothetical protein
MKTLAAIVMTAAVCLSGCTAVVVQKPDGTRVYGYSLFQDMSIPKLTFHRGTATTQPATMPAGETFTMEGYDQKARLDLLNKLADKIP